MTEEDDDAPALPAAKRRAVPANRKQIVGKLWRAARSQIEAHERHLAELPIGTVASEADAKALATLARTVRELVMLDGAAGQGGKANDEFTPAEGLRHVAKLRAELARRLSAVAAAYLGGTAATGDAHLLDGSGGAGGAGMEAVWKDGSAT